MHVHTNQRTHAHTHTLYTCGFSSWIAATHVGVRQRHAMQRAEKTLMHSSTARFFRSWVLVMHAHIHTLSCCTHTLMHTTTVHVIRSWVLVTHAHVHTLSLCTHTLSHARTHKLTHTHTISAQALALPQICTPIQTQSTYEQVHRRHQEEHQTLKTQRFVAKIHHASSSAVFSTWSKHSHTQARVRNMFSRIVHKMSHGTLTRALNKVILAYIYTHMHAYVCM